MDKAIIDAVSSTLAVLKSPTVLRLEDGTFYGWEGVHELEGSCEGTCTHVWSYVYSLCFLFPELERSLRETELNFDIDADGRMYFRTALPLGRGVLDFAPCVDGQMATVIKIYRDWKLSGDTPWLMANWEKVQRILAFVWSENNPYEWDRDHDGILEGRQHHTLDKELFGPSAWLQGMYLAALKAAAEMADFLGKTSEKDEYSRLFEHGYAWMRDNLFNGRYFYQKADLSRQEYVTHFECPEYWNEEAEQLKYQIGDGCAIDQMLAQWHANICGLGSIYDVEQRRIALRSLFDNNYKPTLRRFVNMWRVFALNDEAGVVICDYPEGSYKPSLPIPYADECMTGFEYALAGLMISEGMTEEGLTIIRAVRDRYDGEKRNPWNEMECGSNYARSMAAFALLPLCSGFTFDLPHKHIGFSPVFPGMFRCMWNVATVWGEYKRETFEHTITVATGTLMLNRLSLKGLGTVNAVMVDGKKIAFRQQEETLFLDSMMIRKKIRIIVMQDTVVS